MLQQDEKTLKALELIDQTVRDLELMCAGFEFGKGMSWPNGTPLTSMTGQIRQQLRDLIDGNMDYIFNPPPVDRRGNRIHESDTQNQQTSDQNNQQ